MPTVIKDFEIGQVIIESVIGTTLLLIILKAIFYLLVILWMKVWVDHSLHESLICRESYNTTANCKKLFHKNVKSGQFLFKVINVKWVKKAATQNVELKVIDFLGLEHTFSKELKVSGGKL